LAFTATLSTSTAAVAEVSLGIRSGVGGGMGQAARPVYGGLAGVDADISLGGGWGIGASIARVLVERPTGKRDVHDHLQASVFAVWRSGFKSRTRPESRIAIGAGVRGYNYSNSDERIGDVQVRGVTLLHMQSGLDWRLSNTVKLGLAFEWNFGFYTSQSYINTRDYIEATDAEPPPLRQFVDVTSMYSIGPRLSLTL